MQELTGLRFKRLLLTGAAGALGRMLRPRMKRYCELLRVSDLAAMDPAGDGEEVVIAPLEDEAAMYALLEGVDAVLHFGGVSIEKPFSTVLPANIVGAYNLYEAARRRGTKRIIFASSNHVTGFYGQGETIKASQKFLVVKQGLHPKYERLYKKNGNSFKGMRLHLIRDGEKDYSTGGDIELSRILTPVELKKYGKLAVPHDLEKAFEALSEKDMAKQYNAAQAMGSRDFGDDDEAGGADDGDGWDD